MYKLQAPSTKCVTDEWEITQANGTIGSIFDWRKCKENIDGETTAKTTVTGFYFTKDFFSDVL